MKTTFLVLVSVTAAVTLLQVAPCQAAPRKPINTYDQRQDGKLNVHAQLENFLIVVAPSSSAGSAGDLSGLLQNDLVAQALDLKNIASRVAAHPEDPELSVNSKDDGTSEAEASLVKISGLKSAAEKSEKEPETTVQLIAIVQREIPAAAASAPSPQPSLKTENSTKSEISTEANSEISTETKSEISAEAKSEISTEAKSEISTEAKSEDIDVGETPKKNARSLEKVSGELSESKLPPQTIEQRVPLENKVSGVNEREDPEGPSGREPQELKLLGGAIENCGPGRFRDRSGICESRAET